LYGVPYHIYPTVNLYEEMQVIEKKPLRKLGKCWDGNDASRSNYVPILFYVCSMKEHHLTVSRTARYYSLGEWNADTRQVWFVLHGYGQLAQYFIQKFAILENSQTVVIAPEALSRFYLDQPGASRVGATWMTREDRQNEIDDQIAYLNLLYDTVRDQNDPSRVQINLLGFSQGTATALRWLVSGHVKCHRLVLWAGYFANGIADLVQPNQLAHVETIVAYGTKDEYLEQIDLEKYRIDILNSIPHAQIMSFEGTHTIDLATLKQIANSQS